MHELFEKFLTDSTGHSTVAKQFGPRSSLELRLMRGDG